jgi:hypothetical protein
MDSRKKHTKNLYFEGEDFGAKLGYLGSAKRGYLPYLFAFLR